MADKSISNEYEYTGTAKPKKKKRKRTMGSYMTNKKVVTNRLDEVFNYQKPKKKK